MNRRGAQTQEQRHRNFKTLFKKGNFAKLSILFVNKRKESGGWGGWLLPDDQSHEKSIVMDKTAVEVLSGKNTHNKNPYVLRWKCMRQLLFLSPWILWKMWSSQFRKNFQGA